MSKDAEDLAIGCGSVLLVVFIGGAVAAWELILPTIGLLWCIGWLK